MLDRDHILPVFPLTQVKHYSIPLITALLDITSDHTPAPPDSMATTDQTAIEMQNNPMSNNSVLSKAEKKEKRRLSQIMMEYDVDNNGEFSKEEVIRIVRDMDFIKVKAKRFQCFAIVLVVALVLLVCAMFGVVYFGNEVSKESHVSDDGVLTSASTGNDLVCQDQHTIKSAKEVDESGRRLHRGFGRQLAGVSLASVDCLDVYAAYTSGKKSGEVSFVSASKVAGFTVTTTLTGRADTFLISDTALLSTEMKLVYPVTSQTYNVECALESGKCKSDVQCIVSGTCIFSASSVSSCVSSYLHIFSSRYQVLISLHLSSFACISLYICSFIHILRCVSTNFTGHGDISTSNSNETRRLLIANNRRHLGAGSEPPILADEHYITNRDVDQVTDHTCIAYHCFHGDPLCHFPVDKETHTEQETGRPLCHVRRLGYTCISHRMGATGNDPGDCDYKCRRARDPRDCRFITTHYNGISQCTWMSETKKCLPNRESDMKEGGCHPADHTVQLQNNSTIRMDQLKIGDIVMNGDGAFEPIVAFSHLEPDIFGKYWKFTTASNSTLEIAPGHLFYADGKKMNPDDVKVGAVLSNGERVESKTRVQSMGLYHPHTRSGTLMVNGFKTSTDIALVPKFARGIVNLFFDGFFRLGIPINAGDGIWKSMRNAVEQHVYVMAKVWTALHDTLLANLCAPVAFTFTIFFTLLFVLELLLYSIGALCLERFEILTTSATVVGVGFLVSAYKIKSE